jgi:membrane associated rhomboid family serine protease
MIPLRSSEPHYSTPSATLAIIGANVLVFLYELSLGSGYRLNYFIARYGIVPDHLALFLGCDFDVHSRRVFAHPGEHVVPVDFRPRR